MLSITHIINELSSFPISQINQLFFHSLLSLIFILRMTALIVKVLSLVAERQTFALGQQGRTARVVPVEEIRHPVSYLLSVQENDGSFGDPNPVLHRGVLVIATVRTCIYLLE